MKTITFEGVLKRQKIDKLNYNEGPVKLSPKIIEEKNAFSMRINLRKPHTCFQLSHCSSVNITIQNQTFLLVCKT